MAKVFLLVNASPLSKSLKCTGTDTSDLGHFNFFLTYVISILHLVYENPKNVNHEKIEFKTYLNTASQMFYITAISQDFIQNFQNSYTCKWIPPNLAQSEE